MVKCADCGFLASRDIETRQLEETEQEIRSQGQLVPAPNTGKPIHKYEHPVCFMQSKDYKAFPYTSRSIFTLDREDIRSEIQRERDCKEFTAWQQGYTPKEHRDMIDREKMLKWQAGREDEDRKWREKQDKKLVIIAGSFTILGAVIGALMALFH